MADNLTIIRGTIIHTPTPEAFAILPGHYLVGEKGRVAGIFPSLPERWSGLPVDDWGDALVIPSFIDLHCHAPQYLQMGIGLGLELIDWLEEYTFLLEKRFKNPDYARLVYPHFVEELYRQGTLRSSIYSTIHTDSSLVLVEELNKRGLAAFVGKVNMDRNAPAELMETAEGSIAETLRFLEGGAFNHKVKPILTPRFAPSCSSGLLEALGQLAVSENLPVQSHIGESREEVAWVSRLFGDSSYAKVYHRHKLYGQTPTLMAHAIHMTEEELALTEAGDVTIVHCPDSNINLSSGLMPIGPYRDRGLSIALGSDIGAGSSLFMPRAITQMIQSAKVRHLLDPNERPIGEAEAFYIATKGSGGLFGEAGSFEVGYSLDALVIRDPHPFVHTMTPIERLQRFLYCGGSGQIEARYLEGAGI